MSKVPVIVASAYKPRLPTELWDSIFTFATCLPQFFDSPWMHGLISPFDNVSINDACTGHENDFPLSLATKLSILAVCRDWQSFAKHLVYRDVYIRRASQLEALVSILESSHAQNFKSGIGEGTDLGWWVLNVKIVVASTDAMRNLVPRLISCCPRIEAFIDATPYGYSERTESGLGAFNTTSASSNSRYGGGPLKSLEWTYGGPQIDAFRASPQIMQSLCSLRFVTLHESFASTLAIGSASASIAATALLSFPNLLSLDLVLSPHTLAAWTLTMEWDMPVLQTLVVRGTTDTTSDDWIGAGASAVAFEEVEDGLRLRPGLGGVLERWLEVHGERLRTVDLQLMPPKYLLRYDYHYQEDAPAHDDERGMAADAADPGMDDRSAVSIILEGCPDLDGLVTSSRWFQVQPVIRQDQDAGTAWASALSLLHSKRIRPLKYMDIRREDGSLLHFHLDDADVDRDTKAICTQARIPLPPRRLQYLLRGSSVPPPLRKEKTEVDAGEGGVARPFVIEKVFDVLQKLTFNLRGRIGLGLELGGVRLWL